MSSQQKQETVVSKEVKPARRPTGAELQRFVRIMRMRGHMASFGVDVDPRVKQS